MQKIHIKNFFAIQEAEFDLDKVLLLIGEQASGKSTVAKLVYFFKTLRHDLRRVIFNFINSNSNGKHEISTELKSQFLQEIRLKFIRYFGSSDHREAQIIYEYSESASIRLLLIPGKLLEIEFSQTLSQALFNNQMSTLVQTMQTNRTLSREEKASTMDDTNFRISELILAGFVDNRNTLFIPAYRAMAVSYPDQFKLRLFGNLSADIRELELRQDVVSSSSSIDLYLLRDFIDAAEEIKDVFRERGFEDWTSAEDVHEPQQPNRLASRRLAVARILKILKGKYQYDSEGEKIYFAENEYVELTNASSGQQEVIRVLQDIYLRLLMQQAVCRIIEEPEAHLYPMAQKHLIELFAIMLNNTDSQVIITTHSPYILSVFNNLLYANRVARINPQARDEIAQTIPEVAWLKSETFYAYALKDGKSLSIIDRETGLIDQNYLDEISEQLGDEFNKLYSLHTEAVQ